MTIAAVTTPAKLPVWRTVAEAYRLAFVMAGQLARIAWLWLIVLMAATAALAYAVWPLEEAAKRNNEFSFAGLLLQQPVTAFVTSSVAVAWHRMVLLGEKIARSYLRLDAVVCRYFAFGMLLALPFNLLAFIPFSPLNLLPGAHSGAALAASAALLLVYVAVLTASFVASTRLALILPAIALGRRDATLGDCWRRTRGSFWRLFWGVTLSIIPMILIVLVPIPDPTAAATSAMNVCIYEAIGLLTGVVAVGFLSVAFRHFYPDIAPRNPTAPASA